MDSGRHIVPIEAFFEHHQSGHQTAVFAGAPPLFSLIANNNNYGNADPSSLAPQGMHISYDELATVNMCDVVTSALSTGNATPVSVAGTKDLGPSGLVREIKAYLISLLRMRLYPSPPDSPSPLLL